MDDWSLATGVEQIHKGSVLIDDPMPLPCVGCSGLSSPMGRGASVLDLVLVPSENWSCHWMTNFWASLLNSPVREGCLIRVEEMHGNRFRSFS